MPRLDVTTPTDREIQLVRDFAAPRDLVFAAWTRPELVRKWNYGPEGWTMDVCEIDLRPGGRYRYEWSDGGAGRLAVTGTFTEVTPPERLVSTELFDDDWTGGETLGTVTFTTTPTGTRVTTLLFYTSREARDGAKASGMEIGMAAGLDRLERLLASL
jgi:uncharacterized protein YndB with AHSA1/START domain